MCNFGPERGIFQDLACLRRANANDCGDFTLGLVVEPEIVSEKLLEVDSKVGLLQMIRKGYRARHNTNEISRRRVL